MKKINSKGFTLIELLAVITIMGILMLVAIPAVSRTIENSRRDTFMDTAKAYLNAVKNAVAADEIRCNENASSTEKKVISAMPTEEYYLPFSSAEDSGKDLLEQGGKSSWGSADVNGTIKIDKDVDSGTGITKYSYSIVLIDEGGRGIGPDYISESDLSRQNVKTAGLNKYFQSAKTGAETLVEDSTGTASAQLCEVHTG